MPLDHAAIYVPEDRFQEVLDFYLAALAPLGYKVLQQPIPKVVGLGKDKADWWLSGIGAPELSKGAVHVAFSTMSRGDVDKFHDAAIAAGGKDNGKPGIRAHYHPNYYGAFVADPIGNNMEVVCHMPDSA